MNWKTFLPIWLKNLWRMMLFFKFLVRLSTEAIWAWAFLCSSLFDYYFNLFSCYNFIHFSISSWLSFSSLLFFENFPFHVGCLVYWHTIIHNIPIIMLFYICKIGSNVLSFILYFKNLLLSFFLVSLVKVCLNFFDLYQKATLVLLIFIVFFYSLCHLFLLWCSVFPSFCLL